MLFAFMVYGQNKVLLKVYHKDESINQYPITDIENISFTQGNDFLTIKVYYESVFFDRYFTSSIDSITISKDLFENNYFNIYFKETEKKYNINWIDSLIIKEIETAVIGNQIWMAENLDVCTFRNGEQIIEIKNNSDWCETKVAAWCHYNNDNNKGIIYGKLYNWYAVCNRKGLAPYGWAVPRDDDWQELIMYLGGDSTAGGLLKESDYEHWLKPNTSANNLSGFSALPGGKRYFTGIFDYEGISGYWWTTTDGSDSSAWCRSLSSKSAAVTRIVYPKIDGLSIRCIKKKE